MPLVLASASPRRAELLSSAGIPFTVATADIDETPLPDESAADYVVRVAGAKASAVWGNCRQSGSVVLAADTAVVVGGQILGKPSNREAAKSMLKSLSDRVHRVMTGVVVRAPAREIVELAVTRVHVLPLSDAEIDWYLETGEHEGKAGGYAIQGRAARFIDWIDGSWSNVVGLPLATVHRMLKAVGEVD